MLKKQKWQVKYYDKDDKVNIFTLNEDAACASLCLLARCCASDWEEAQTGCEMMIALQILGPASGSYYEQILLLFSCFDIHKSAQGKCWPCGSLFCRAHNCYLKYFKNIQCLLDVFLQSKFGLQLHEKGQKNLDPKTPLVKNWCSAGTRTFYFLISRLTAAHGSSL